MSNTKASLPKVYKKLVAHKLSTSFKEATKIVTTPLQDLKPNEVLVKTKYLGINATDINITAGRYAGENPVLPIDTGLEGLGEVVAVGSQVKNVKVGQYVGFIVFGAYAEYMNIPAEAVSIFPELNPEYITLLISGRTAVMGLDIAGRIQKSDTVLVTAAAGGLGVMAVQYAKSLGCHVIGTCSSDEKVKLLKELKCDRPVNYRKENLGEVLKKEYPKGVDIVWETIGGEMFELCLKNLAFRGRLVIIGFITGYKSDEGMKPVDLKDLPKHLLWSSRTIAGWGLPDYPEEFPKYHAKLLEMHKSKQFKLFTDFGDQTPGGKFIGLESIARAVEYLHSGTTTGKIIITMQD